MTTSERNAALWKAEASNWICWARRPDHDAYWHYRDGFLAMVGTGVALTLDLGCGEGRVARDLTERGHKVIGIDTAFDLVRAAADEDANCTYLVADAASLPFRSGSFHTVVAHNVLMDVDDLGGAVADIARVMSPGGCLAASVLHPLSSAGRFADDSSDADFIIMGSYFERRHVTTQARRDGLTVNLSSYHRTLEDYVIALCSNGLELTGLSEPQPRSRGGPIRSQSARRGQRIPMLLHLSAVKRATDSSSTLGTPFTD